MMRTRNARAFGAALIVWLTAIEGVTEPLPVIGADGDRLGRQELIAAVLASNRELAAARAAVEASRALADMVRTLPNLMASYSFGPLSIFDDGTRYGQVIQVGQELPWPGTLTRRGEQAQAFAEADERELEALRRELALAASQAYDDYHYLQRALVINQVHLDLMHGFQQVATARYAAGIAPQQAPLAAEVETAHLEHRAVVLAADRQVVVAHLNRLLHRKATAPLPEPPENESAAVAVPELSPDNLIALALGRRPEVSAARARIDAHTIGVDLARLDGRPDLRPMASYNSMWNQDAHRWMVGLGVSIPVWRQRVEAGVAVADAELAAETQRLEALEDRIVAEVNIALGRLTESRHVVSLYVNRLLPAARDQTRAAQSGFETGQVDFLALIDAERNLREVELGLVAAETDVHRRLAALQQAVGLMPGEAWPAAAPESGSIDHPAGRPASTVPQPTDKVSPGASSPGSNS